MITVYHSWFSTTGPFPDRPLPYSQAPSGCVRLLSVGTMRQLRLPGASCVTPFVALQRNTSVDFLLSLVVAGKSPRQRQGVVRPVSPSCSGVCPKDAFGSPKFPANSFDLCPALGPRTVPCARSSDSARMWSPQLLPRRHRPVMTFEALSHGFSHGCLRFVPSSRTTTQNSLPVADLPSRVGFSIPTEFVWRVSHFRAPLPQDFSWREAVLIMTVCVSSSPTLSGHFVELF
jgi:hypothetical protein